MPDDRDLHGGAGIPVGEALAALPLEAPDRSAWPALAAQLSARRRRSGWPGTKRWPLAFAAAAVLALAVVLPLRLLPDTVDRVAAAPADAPVAAPADTRLAALMGESARLEALLALADDDRYASAPAAALAIDLEDRVRAVDAALAGAGDPDRRRVLWARRVGLLRELAGLESSRQWLAARGDRFDGALVLAY